MNYLYYNDSNTLRCGSRKIDTKQFNNFDNTILTFEAGKYIISIDISANVTEEFYTLIDQSKDHFIDSPFNIYIKIGDSTQSFTIGQYTPVNIHITKYVEFQKFSKVSISSSLEKKVFSNIDINVVTEQLS